MTTPSPAPEGLYRFTFPSKETVTWFDHEGRTVAEEDYPAGSVLRRAKVEARGQDPRDPAGLERWTVTLPDEPDEGSAVLFVGPGRVVAEALTTGYIARGDPHAQSGCVRWPMHRERVELGCAVVAIVREKRFDEDPFQRALATASITLAHNDPVVTEEEERALWPEYDLNPDRFASVPMLAAVTLGTCGASFADWRPTRDDLTPEGLALVQGLEALYARPVELLLFVDT